MARWIKGFPPRCSGNYLVTIIPFKAYPIKRLEYDSNIGIWKTRNGSEIGYDIIISYYWWDEYGHTEEKKTLKIKI